MIDGLQDCESANDTLPSESGNTLEVALLLVGLITPYNAVLINPYQSLQYRGSCIPQEKRR